MVPKVRALLIYQESGRRVFSTSSEGYNVNLTGALRSKNVGTSNRKSGESPDRRKPKVSLTMSISQGLVGPKAMTKVVVDGHMVNIP